MPEISESIAKELIKRKILEVDEQGCYCLVEKKKPTADTPRAIEHILKSRLKKRATPYQITPKLAKLLKNKINFIGLASVLAAWDTFIEEKFDDPNHFFRKGCTIESFVSGQCFERILETPYYKSRVAWHEVNTLSLKPLPAEGKGLCDRCATPCEQWAGGIKSCPRFKSGVSTGATVAAIMAMAGRDG